MSLKIEKRWLKRRKYKREWARKNMRMRTRGGGKITCLKCGREGYKQFREQFNETTNKVYGVYTVVYHMHRENGKWIYEGFCYIGRGRL